MAQRPTTVQEQRVKVEALRPHGGLFWLFWGAKKRADFFGVHPKKVPLNKNFQHTSQNWSDSPS
jgi:hypothetical protein